MDVMPYVRFVVRTVLLVHVVDYHSRPSKYL